MDNIEESVHWMERQCVCVCAYESACLHDMFDTLLSSIDTNLFSLY